MYTVVDSGCLRGRDEKIKRALAVCGGAESNDAFMVKQLQTLVNIKIVLLCDSNVTTTL